MTGRVQVVVGNPRPASRTAAAASRVAAACARELGREVAEPIELSSLAGELFDWGADGVTAAKRAVLDAELLVVASPTYKAAYTGLLKAFLDHIGGGELAGRPCVALMTAGSAHHALAVETQLRPVLVELGATVVALTETDLDGDLDGTGDDEPGWLAAWLAVTAPVLRRLVPPP